MHFLVHLLYAWIVLFKSGLLLWFDILLYYNPLIPEKLYKPQRQDEEALMGTSQSAGSLNLEQDGKNKPAEYRGTTE